MEEPLESKRPLMDCWVEGAITRALISWQWSKGGGGGG